MIVFIREFTTKEDTVRNLMCSTKTAVSLGALRLSYSVWGNGILQVLGMKHFHGILKFSYLELR